VFSPQDYEFASRVLGLPCPKTPAEMAAAAPMTATVLRNFHRVAPPMPGMEGDGIMTSPTRSLNGYPDTSQPEVRGQLMHRLQASASSPADEAELQELVGMLFQDPNLMQMFLEFVQNLSNDGLDGAEYLSRQRPLEYDLPNYGGQYSVLNAPSSSTVPASVMYQELG
jgi:hypothetical protein